MVQSISPNHPLRRLFSGLVEQAFCTEIGLCDPALTEYLSDLLVSFVHIDRLREVRKAEGKDLQQIATMLLVLSGELPSDPVMRDRSMYRQIGDYTLFWAGIYPEHLCRSKRRPHDVLVDYVQQGRRSYAIVSDLADEDDAPPSSLFRHLSDDFESCIHGLGLVRRGWERNRERDSDEGGRLLY